MKTAKFKTSSVIIDLEKSTFEHFSRQFKIVAYPLPYNFSKNHGDYALNHKWAKNNIDDPYYLFHPSKKIFVLRPSDAEMEVLEHESRKLNPTIFTDYRDPKYSHIWMKVLLASFLNKKGRFYSNDQFYIHSEVNKTQSAASVIKINLKHDYQETKDVLFNITASATTLKQVSLSDYNQFHRKEIPYGMFQTKSGYYFKQLKLTELKDSNKIFIKRKNSKIYNKKTSIPFHSIEGKEALLKSKEYNLQQFIDEFNTYLNHLDIHIASKYLEFEQLEYKLPEALTIENSSISIVDCRLNQDKNPLIKILKKNMDKNQDYEIKKMEKLKEGDAVLFVMDYDEKIYEELIEDKNDPYKEVKQYFDEIGVTSQGINVNENSKKDKIYKSLDNFLNYKVSSLKMKFKVCLSQLNLKQKIRQKSIDFPHIELIVNKVYVHKGYLLCIKNNKLCIEPIQEENIKRLMDTVSEVTGFDFNLSIINKLRDFQYPFNKSKPLDFNRLSLIFSNNGVCEIKEYPEQVLYDDGELRDRIETRNKVRPISDFKLGQNSTYAENFNAFIDNVVSERYLSYAELDRKYGKGDNENIGFHKAIFGAGNEIKYRKELKKSRNLEIKGLKQDRLFKSHSGIWYHKGEKKYYVGKRSSYKFQQSSSYQMRKIVEHTPDTFKPDEYYPLLVVDFIRNGENTVLPYPFGLINVHSQMQASIMEI